jgi:hypothetical protein
VIKTFQNISPPPTGKQPSTIIPLPKTKSSSKAPKKSSLAGSKRPPEEGIGRCKAKTGSKKDHGKKTNGEEEEEEEDKVSGQGDDGI